MAIHSLWNNLSRQGTPTGEEANGAAIAASGRENRSDSDKHSSLLRMQSGGTGYGGTTFALEGEQTDLSRCVVEYSETVEAQEGWNTPARSAAAAVTAVAPA